ncbi:hypothetical protein [Hymenobacter sp. UYP22]|uniref:hypothetical protein n=1 Tax=Hymenobacter sp. UYP22 TaxID=3156348 RepID=UPI0033979C61
MLSRFFVIGCMSLLAGSAFGQQTSIGQAGAAAQANMDALVDGAAAVLPRGNSYGTIGTPYVDNRWLQGHLRMTTGVPLTPIPLKYDVLNRRLLMRPLNRRDSLALDDRKLAGFELDVPVGLQPAHKRTFRRFLESPVPAQRAEYVEVLHAGKYTLLKRFGKTLLKASYQGAYSSGERYDKIEDKPTYYLLRPDQKLEPVKLSLKALQAAAPELAPALKNAPGSSQAKTEEEWAAVLAAIDAKAVAE